FTISALLFGGAGFLLSTKSLFSRPFSVSAALGISIAGVIITVLGGFGIGRIIAYQRAFLDRGLEVEGMLGTELIKTSKRVWDRASQLSAVGLTKAVFCVFGLGWVLLAADCLLCLLWSRGCPSVGCGP